MLLEELLFSLAGNIPASGETVVLRRSTPQTQGVDLIENDPLPANTLEDALDKATSISQELQEQVDRSFKDFKNKHDDKHGVHYFGN